MSGDLRTLREKAEAAIESPAWQSLFVVGGRRAGKTALYEFLTASNPTAVLALLDRLEAAEAAVERVRALIHPNAEMAMLGACGDRWFTDQDIRDALEDLA